MINNGEKCTFFTLKNDISPNFAVLQLAELLHKYPSKIIIKIKSDEEMVVKKLKEKLCAKQVIS